MIGAPTVQSMGLKQESNHQQRQANTDLKKKKLCMSKSKSSPTIFSLQVVWVKAPIHLTLRSMKLSPEEEDKYSFFDRLKYWIGGAIDDNMMTSV